MISTRKTLRLDGPGGAVLERCLKRLGDLDVLHLAIKSLLINLRVKQAAQRTIRIIQSRLGDAEKGRLSLAEAQGLGSLSLAEQPGGLSLAPPPEKEPGDV